MAKSQKAIVTFPELNSIRPPEPGKENAIQITTSANRGYVTTMATVVQYEKGDVFNSVSFVMFQDFNKTIDRTKKRGTQKAIDDAFLAFTAAEYTDGLKHFALQFYREQAAEQGVRLDKARRAIEA